MISCSIHQSSTIIMCWFIIIFCIICSVQTATINTKIMGGTRVSVQNYPYQVSMQYQGRHICGGSILSTKFVLTAAHCTDKISPSQVTFRAGSSTRTRNGQVVKAKTVRQHPKFNVVDYDVAVVEVVPKFVFNSQLKNVAIALKEPGQGTQMTVSGWGTLRETSNRLPSELRAVEIPIVDRRACTKTYSNQQQITTRMICAGSSNKDSCQGDSGGPLVTVRGTRLAGVVSWGFGCGRRRYPGVYTNLNDKEIRSFIRETTGI